MYVRYPMFAMLIGVISTTRKVKIPRLSVSFSQGKQGRTSIQFVAVASAADLVRIASGAYSAGTGKLLALSEQCLEDQHTQPGNPQKPNSEKEVEQE